MERILTEKKTGQYESNLMSYNSANYGRRIAYFMQANNNKYRVKTDFSKNFWYMEYKSRQ